jgi:hypothetical protein
MEELEGGKPKKTCHDSQSLDQDSNLESPKYEAGLLNDTQ